MPHVVQLTLTAGEQFEGLLDHYLDRNRGEAVENLFAAPEDASARIAADPTTGARYPPPYRAAARWNFRWVREGRYWFAHSDRRGFPVITNILYVTANILGRIAAEDEGLIAPPRRG